MRLISAIDRASLAGREPDDDDDASDEEAEDEGGALKDGRRARGDMARVMPGFASDDDDDDDDDEARSDDDEACLLLSARKESLRVITPGALPLPRAAEEPDDLTIPAPPVFCRESIGGPPPPALAPAAAAAAFFAAAAAATAAAVANAASRSAASATAFASDSALSVPSMADTNRDSSEETALPPLGFPSLEALAFLARPDAEEADEADEAADEEADGEANEDDAAPARGVLPTPPALPLLLLLPPPPLSGIEMRTPLSDPRRFLVLAKAAASSSSSFALAPFLPLLLPDFPTGAAADDEDAAAEEEDEEEAVLENDQPLPSLSCSLPTSLTTDMDCKHGRL